jgi:hypothetical protein
MATSHLSVRDKRQTQRQHKDRLREKGRSIKPAAGPFAWSITLAFTTFHLLQAPWHLAPKKDAATTTGPSPPVAVLLAQGSTVVCAGQYHVFSNGRWIPGDLHMRRMHDSGYLQLSCTTGRWIHGDLHPSAGFEAFQPLPRIMQEARTPVRISLVLHKRRRTRWRCGSAASLLRRDTISRRTSLSMSLPISIAVLCC